MKVITKNDMPAVVAFNRLVYGGRRDVEDRIDLVSSSPWLATAGACEGMIAVNQQKAIVGQLLFIPGRAWHGCQSLPMHWSCDLHVLERHRDTPIGGLLTVAGLRSFSPFFGAGFSAKGEAISVAAKALPIGMLHGYAKANWTIVGSAIRAAMRRPDEGKFPVLERTPSEIVVGDRVFRLINSPRELDDWEFRPFDPSVIEFDRSREFLAWRFFTKRPAYLFYRSKDGTDTYFAAKPMRIRRRGIVFFVLSIVDYRVSLAHDGLVDVLAAARVLSRRIGAEMLWTASSNTVSDLVLRRAGYFRIGRPGLILTTMPHTTASSEVTARRSIMMTPADADVDLNR